MEKIEIIQKDIQKELSQKRYIHSVGVMKMAQILAKKYNENEQIAKLVGLAHDIAKEYTIEQNKEYIKQNKIEIDEIEEKVPALIHAKIGAHIAKEKYQFTLEMQNAIKYHTTGNPNMDKLAKIIYVADKTEENRNFEGVEELRTIALKNLDEAVLAILNFDIQKNINKGVLIHPNSIKTRNTILVTENGSFLP